MLYQREGRDTREQCRNKALTGSRLNLQETRRQNAYPPQREGVLSFSPSNSTYSTQTRMDREQDTIINDLGYA